MPEDEEEQPVVHLPTPPVFNVKRVFDVRDRLLTLVLDSWVGTVPVGDSFSTMVEQVRTHLNASGPTIEHYPLRDSMKYLAGREMTQRLLHELAWRLAGNMDRLRTSRVVNAWSNQEGVEWVPLQVVATRYEIKKRQGSKFGRAGRTMRFAILAGSPCPMQITQWWSNEKIDVVAYAVGFKRKPPMYKADHSELMSLRFLGLIDPARSTREPGFFHVSCPTSFLEYNRAVIRQRRRIRFQCPQGYEHHCHVCPHGARSCEAAVHPEDYEWKSCTACGKESWFDTDPAFVNDYCIHCQPMITAGLPIKRAEPDKPQESK